MIVFDPRKSDEYKNNYWDELSDERTMVRRGDAVCLDCEPGTRGCFAQIFWEDSAMLCRALE